MKSLKSSGPAGLAFTVQCCFPLEFPLRAAGKVACCGIQSPQRSASLAAPAGSCSPRSAYCVRRGGGLRRPGRAGSESGCEGRLRLCAPPPSPPPPGRSRCAGARAGPPGPPWADSVIEDKTIRPMVECGPLDHPFFRPTAPGGACPLNVGARPALALPCCLGRTWAPRASPGLWPAQFLRIPRAHRPDPARPLMPLGFPPTLLPSISGPVPRTTLAGLGCGLSSRSL